MFVFQNEPLSWHLQGLQVLRQSHRLREFHVFLPLAGFCERLVERTLLLGQTKISVVTDLSHTDQADKVDV